MVAPPVSVPTAEIFSAKELTRDTEILIMQGFAAHKTRNDMQAVVCVKYPEVAESLEWLSRYGDARMSGSGACLFAPFGTEGQARQVAASAPSGWKVWVARGLDRHPLKDWVAG
jgi:4-diphosphocytidyl-2-C-methyl-D-erythritol kinase